MLLQGAADVVLAVDDHPAAVDLHPLQARRAVLVVLVGVPSFPSRRYFTVSITVPLTSLLYNSFFAWFAFGSIDTNWRSGYFSFGQSVSTSSRNDLSKPFEPQAASASSSPPCSRV